MKLLPEGYCIDTTEVTQAQYAAWLNTTTQATIAAQDATSCGWNRTFVPEPTCTPSCQLGCANDPQVCVDWCDAYAYCKGVGKRLCGKIGGGPNPYDGFANASTSQWYGACSSAGLYKFPYGNTLVTTNCNIYEFWAPNYNYSTTQVGNLTACQAGGAYAGVYDLSGNALEWEDSCDATTPAQSGFCRLRGGCFAEMGTVSMACSYGNYGYRETTDYLIGFRCCSL